MSSESTQQIKHLWVIAGPAGCGKSTVATHLAEELKLPFLEGDDYHTAENKEKMHTGHPLTDADRWDWLILLRQAAVDKIIDGAAGVIVACSALKQKYRDVLRIASYFHHDIDVHLVYLHANMELLIERVKARQGHYMKDMMVRSQFDSLEEPKDNELAKDCLIVDVSGPSAKVQASALQAVKGAIAKAAATTHAKTSN